jgi:hypothetical protein
VRHNSFVKSNIVTDALRSLPRSVGLIGTSDDKVQPIIAGERSPDVVSEALAAAKRLRARAKRMKLGLTDDDIRRWVKEGRQ